MADRESQPLLRSSSRADNIYCDERKVRVFISSRQACDSSKVATIAILFSLTMERIAFYALAVNLFLFLNHVPLLWLSYDAMKALFVFTGVTFVASFLGGWLADSILGRYYTIILAFIIYAGGYFFLPFLKPKKGKDELTHIWCSSSVSKNEQCDWLIYIILIVIALGTGTIKANIAPFGADQVRLRGRDAVRTFFFWFYWVINIGGLVAIGGLGYLQSRENGFYWGYMIPVMCLGAALVVLLMTCPAYIRQRPSGSVLTVVLAVLKEACKSNKRHRARARANTDVSVVPSPGEQPSWLDRAKVMYGGKFRDNAVEDVKVLGRVSLIFVMLIPYWLVYFQMTTTFQAQGLHMELVPGSTDLNFKIPSAWLTLFNVIFVLIFIPVMNKLVYPYLDRRGYHFKLLTRMTLGMFLAFLSMGIAGGLETYRLHVIHQNRTITQVISNTTFYAAKVSIFWQIPQYSLIGLSEVFASVAGLEYACSETPAAMQGVVMGIFYLCTGVGSFLGTGLLSIVQIWWFSEKDFGNINYGHLDYYFYLLAGIQGVSVLIFHTVCKRLPEHQPPDDLSQTASMTQPVQDHR